MLTAWINLSLSALVKHSPALSSSTHNCTMIVAQTEKYRWWMGFWKIVWPENEMWEMPCIFASGPHTHLHNLQRPGRHPSEVFIATNHQSIVANGRSNHQCLQSSLLVLTLAFPIDSIDGSGCWIRLSWAEVILVTSKNCVDATVDLGNRGSCYRYISFK